jgi:hypothetical protein
MANEIRVRPNFVAGGLSADMASGATSMFSAGLADLPAITAVDHAALTLWRTDLAGRVTQKEIIWVTAHTGGASTATVVRGREGTTAQNWLTGDRWSCTQLSSDVPTICTSATRPTNPYHGMLIWETDSKRLLAYDGAAWQVQSGDTGWVMLTLLNGWVMYDNAYGPSGYLGLATAPILRRIGNIVYTRGLIRSGSLGSIIAVLPAGYRPGLKLLLAADRDTVTHTRIDIEPAGNIIHAGGSNGYLQFNYSWIADN